MQPRTIITEVIFILQHYYYSYIILVVSQARNRQQRKESQMKMGHVVGTRKVTRKSQSWYDKVQEEHLRKIEAEIAAKQQAEQAGQAK